MECRLSVPGDGQRYLANHTRAITLDQIRLNQVAQGVVNTDDALSEFKVLRQATRSETIHRLGMMTAQSHPTHEELAQGIVTSGLKRTFTPCVMLAAGDLDSQVTRLWQLPDNELDKCFILLIHVFRIADNRRRKLCGSACSHWWHRDLSQAAVVDELRAELGT